MGCASPIKFPDTLELCGVPVPDHYQNFYGEIQSKDEYCTKLPDDMKEWENILLRFIDNLSKGNK